MRLENAAHMALTDAQARSQLCHRRCAVAPQARFVQQVGGLAGQDEGGILGGPGQQGVGPCGSAGRCQFRAAAQARSKASGLGLRRQGIELAVLAFGRAHAADWSAVNAGGGHAGKKTPVKPCITRLERQVTGVVGIVGALCGYRIGFGGWHGVNHTQHRGVQ
jgi:hypothetical protein